jgi:hypothetical protein
VKFSLVSFSVGTGKPRELLWFGADEEEAAMIEDVEEVGSDTITILGKAMPFVSGCHVFIRPVHQSHRKGITEIDYIDHLAS